MPPIEEPKQETTPARPAALDDYPPEAFEFLQDGLAYTIQTVHGDKTRKPGTGHVGGRQLCDGLKDLAIQRWGYLAETVLARWNITHTLDFGRMVYAMIEVGGWSKTAEDSMDDFRGVYDFKRVFQSAYRVGTGAQHAGVCEKSAKSS